jgi:predicted ATP-binding protein involved in virulence
MHLTSLTLENFRCFEHLAVDFHPEFTVLIAPNGSGKTTVLDAARVALWSYVKGFDLGAGAGGGATLEIADVRLAPRPDGGMEPQLPARISAQGVWDDGMGERVWTQTRERVKPRSNAQENAAAKQLKTFASQLERQVRAGEAVILPLVSYLGTSRLWFEGRFTSAAKEVTLENSEYSRTSGYRGCLTYVSSFKAFCAWYGWVFRSYREEQILALERKQPLSETGQRFAGVIAVVTTAVDALVQEATGWHGLQYRASQNQQLVMDHPQFGTMPVEMLSDGTRNAIAMVADLAFRTYKLNPHLGAEAAHQTPGIALIDEVDMFLHPSWQQTIVSSLRRAFPNIQFIVTTHSPQVLSTLPRDNIREIALTPAGGMARMPDFSPLAHESGAALAKVMGVHQAPPLPIQDDIHQFELLVRANQEHSDEARALRSKLDAAGYQFHDSDLATWRFLASRRAMEGKST